MKLYNANLSPNALRVRAVANELGIALEVIDVDLRSGGNRTKEFLALNPNGKVPVLVDGDFVLWESRAINAYLATMKPESGLYPADIRKRAVVLAASTGRPCRPYWTICSGPSQVSCTLEMPRRTGCGMAVP